MIGIVVTGHNTFAEGVTSTVEMIAGKQDNYEVVNFLDGSSHEDLYEALKGAIHRVMGEHGVIVFTDLKGGTPFQQAVMIAMEVEQVEVLTGTNIAMLLEGALMHTASDNVHELANKLVDTGLDQVSRFDKASLTRDETDDFEDGI